MKKVVVIRSYYLFVVMELAEGTHNYFHSIEMHWTQNLAKDWLKGLILQQTRFHLEFVGFHN